MNLPVAVAARFRLLGMRGRLTLWYAISIPIVIFVLAVGARAVLVAALQEALDEGLRERAQNLNAAVLASIPAGASEYEFLVDSLTQQSLPSVPLWLRVTDPRGRTLGAFGEIPSQLVGPLDRMVTAGPGREGSFSTIRIENQAALRVYTVSVIGDTGNEVAIIQTADSLAPLAAAQARLWWYTAAVGAAGSLLTVIVGVFIAHQGYKPLGRILKRVREVETSNLSAPLEEEPRPHELQMLADSLNSMWRRLDAAFSSQQRFVADASHDLRTPLTALRGQLEVIMMNPSLSPAIKGSLVRANNEVNRLIRMTNNLLTVARFDTRLPVARSPVDLRELMEAVVMDMRGVAGHLSLTVAHGVDAVVVGDYDLLKQALINVVDNALKFTSTGGAVTLSLAIDAGEAVLSVADSGIGMSPERVRRLQDSSGAAWADRGSGGSGLGLGIVNRVCRVHEGRVEIASSEHVGTTVSLRLPLLVGITGRALSQAPTA